MSALPPPRSTRRLWLRAPEPGDIDALFAITLCSPLGFASLRAASHQHRQGGAQLAGLRRLRRPARLSARYSPASSRLARHHFVPELERDAYQIAAGAQLGR